MLHAPGIHPHQTVPDAVLVVAVGAGRVVAAVVQSSSAAAGSQHGTGKEKQLPPVAEDRGKRSASVAVAGRQPAADAVAGAAGEV